MLNTLEKPAAQPEFAHHLKTTLDERGSKQLLKAQAWLQGHRGQRVPLPEVVKYLLERLLLDPEAMAHMQAELSE